MSRERFLDPASTERQGVELVFDLREKCLGLWITQWDFSTILIYHIVTAIRCVEDGASTRGSERLDRKQLTFFHFGVVRALDDWDALAGVNRVWTD